MRWDFNWVVNNCAGLASETRYDRLRGYCFVTALIKDFELLPDACAWRDLCVSELFSATVVMPVVEDVLKVCEDLSRRDGVVCDVAPGVSL